MIKQRMIKLKNEKILRLKKLVTSNDIWESLIKLRMMPAAVNAMRQSVMAIKDDCIHALLPVIGFVLLRVSIAADFTKLTNQ